MNLYVNLDFEYEYLLGERRAAGAVRAQNERWSHIMRLVRGWRDATSKESSAPGRWLPWGVTPSFEALHPEGDFPPCAIVERVNSKLYSAGLENSLDINLPGTRTVRSVEDLRYVLANARRDCLIKNPWGVAGRERLRTSFDRFDEDSSRWAERQFHRVDALLVEPWVDRSADWSIQYHLENESELVGSCRLVTDAAGHHRGHRVGNEKPGRAILEPAGQIAAAVHAEGYRGPLGIDAFEGDLDGADVVRPLCELNARMTFGRLALELQAHVGRPFVWWHPPKSRSEQSVEPVALGADDGMYRLPEFADPSGKSGSVIVLGDDQPWVS